MEAVRQQRKTTWHCFGSVYVHRGPLLGFKKHQARDPEWVQEVEFNQPQYAERLIAFEHFRPEYQYIYRRAVIEWLYDQI